MDNLDFDKRIREMMEAHTEEPPVGSWDLIASGLQRRRSARIRRTYAYSAVAAVLLLFFVISPDIFPGGSSVKAAKENFAISALSKADSKIAVVETLRSPSPIAHLRRAPAGSSANERAYGLNVEKAPEREVAKDSIVVRYHEPEIEIAKGDLTNENNEKEAQRVAEEKKTDNRVVRNILIDDMFDNIPREDIDGRPIFAFAAGVSPSYSGAYTDPGLMARTFDGRNNVNPVYLKSEAPREEVFEEEYMMPVTVGFQIFFPITSRFSAGTGVNYSMLSTNYSAHSINSGTTEHRRVTLHYIGVPINFQYRIFSGGSFKFYALGGTTIEKGLAAVDKNIDTGVRTNKNNEIQGVQLSVNAGLGLEMGLSDSMGLYFDPNITYYFDNKKKPQPFSIRTVQPLLFRFEAGLRFRL